MPAAEPPRRPMTDEQWASMAEDEPGELVDGALAEEEAPDWVHEAVVGWLVWTLRSWSATRGFVAGSELKYLLRKGRGRKPDISVVLPGSPPPPARGVVRRPPDIMIEVVSPRPGDVRREIERLGPPEE